MDEQRLDFKYPLKQEVFWMHHDKPATGKIIRRGYQETWHDPESDDFDGQGGYTTNYFYEVRGWLGKAIFHESDFGKRCFDSPTAFARSITRPA